MPSSIPAANRVRSSWKAGETSRLDMERARGPRSLLPRSAPVGGAEEAALVQPGHEPLPEASLTRVITASSSRASATTCVQVLPPSAERKTPLPAVPAKTVRSDS